MDTVALRCSVKGCDTNRDLFSVVLVVPKKDARTKIDGEYLQFRVPSMLLCEEHAKNVRNPYEFFVSKPKLVRRMLRALVDDPKNLDFDEIRVRFDQHTTHDTVCKDTRERVERAAAETPQFEVE